MSECPRVVCPEVRSAWCIVIVVIVVGQWIARRRNGRIGE
jgi:hypothetical protein